MNLYIAPSFKLTAFSCPHCSAIAHQSWIDVYEYNEYSGNFGAVECIWLSQCENPNCGKRCIWINEKLVYPGLSTAPFPEDDMPSDVKEDFLEAREVVETSPRSAAALLRLALQKLMKHLGQEGKDINKDIGELVKKGLPVKIKLALDSLRVYGNEAVHPGEIDLKDDKETALKLFKLLNIIVHDMITQPKEIEELFYRLPQSKLEGIKNRDNKLS
ncbi:hypothetical protein ASJ81_06050 [Methanosarcina spelaei]|uniref:DUF4145 domain-containing protein n=1 Tax=Methanosarcina spelaei TaxID=1036679 RepID=A0A2A2HT26_9EURY|nr:DUF4145 domain-containing protein [Methanosarcina spelaei]PAV12617.1 hypothetical protein ASJ81_06050 [Methanosarcina spelaei]